MTGNFIQAPNFGAKWKIFGRRMKKEGGRGPRRREKKHEGNGGKMGKNEDNWEQKAKRIQE